MIVREIVFDNKLLMMMNFVGSESGQKTECKTTAEYGLQHNSTFQPPPPPPQVKQTHCLYILYCTVH
jgi:hypothetical protein